MTGIVGGRVRRWGEGKVGGTQKCMTGSGRETQKFMALSMGSCVQGGGGC